MQKLTILTILTFLILTGCKTTVRIHNNSSCELMDVQLGQDYLHEGLVTYGETIEIKVDEPRYYSVLFYARKFSPTKANPFISYILTDLVRIVENKDKDIYINNTTRVDTINGLKDHPLCD